MPERQQAETLRRDLKTQRDALASVQDRLNVADRQREKLSGEVDALSRRESEVRAFQSIPDYAHGVDGVESERGGKGPRNDPRQA